MIRELTFSIPIFYHDLKNSNEINRRLKKLILDWRDDIIAEKITLREVIDLESLFEESPNKKELSKKIKEAKKSSEKTIGFQLSIVKINNKSLPSSPKPPATKPKCIAKNAGFHLSGYLEEGVVKILIKKLIIYPNLI